MECGQHRDPDFWLLILVFVSKVSVFAKAFASNTESKRPCRRAAPARLFRTEQHRGSEAEAINNFVEQLCKE